MTTKAGIDLAELLASWEPPARSWIEQERLGTRATDALATGTIREYFKYTPITGLLERMRELPDDAGTSWTGLEQAGVRAVSFSGLDRTEAARVATALERGYDAARHVLGDLALLRASDGLLIEITGQPEQPIELGQIADGTRVVLLSLAPGASATLVERCGAGHAATQLLVTDIGRDATLAHHRALFPEDGGLWSLVQVNVEDGGRYTLDQNVTGGNRIRLETHITLSGRGAATKLNGAAVIGAGQHLDQQMTIEHRAPGTTSQQRFHAIGMGKGRSVFNGRIHIHPGAGQSDAWLSNRNLAMHPDAEMNTKPELEIYTDDVRCAHGATVGQLDHEGLFFLNARGIPEGAAKTMLAHAFLRECIGGDLAEEATRQLLGAMG